MTINHFHYDLPPERIAHSPLVPRDSSRLLVVNRITGELQHKHFFDLPDLLSETDVIVRNNTKVIPARLFGQKETGGKCEILLIKHVSHDAQSTTWECMTKPGIKPGARISFANSSLSATCEEITGFTRSLRFNQFGSDFFTSIDAIGHTPVPPYIHWEKIDESELRRVYQTTFAQFAGSVAAPTAGLHFTPELDERLRKKGIGIEEVTLHVGLGTFLPLQPENILSGKLHHEVYNLTPETAQHLNTAQQEKKRIIAVGTTTTRVLETCSDQDGTLHAQSGETDLFIQPGYRFSCVSALITNFHLPESSLLMLISAFASKPNAPHTFDDFSHSLLGTAYAEAIRLLYRFYSFGDAVLIL